MTARKLTTWKRQAIKLEVAERKFPGWAADALADLDAADLEIVDLKAKIAELKGELQQAGNVLAVIHRDGGHYISKHGWRKACMDAKTLVVALRQKAIENELEDLRLTAEEDKRQIARLQAEVKHYLQMQLPDQ